MPRKSSGPRLWFDRRRQTYTIVDGRKRIRTGCGADEIGTAKEVLGRYLAETHTPDEADPFISDILTAYSEEHLAGKLSEKNILYDIAHLAKWWGGKRVNDVTQANFKAYVKHRDAGACSRREMTFLLAAMRHWNVHHGSIKIPTIKLPPPPEPRPHFITRDQAAKFLWHARKTPHLARFFLIGWYTGSRRGVIGGLRWDMIDFESQVMLRKPPGVQQAHNKRSPKVRIGSRLIAHLKRWKRLDGKGAEYVVAFRGQPLIRPLRSWQRARKAAKLPAYVTPHILRHSRATNMLRQGVDPWEASNALGMSLQTLLKVYGHHIPDWQKNAADAR